jgi:hypothetical protein
LDRDVVVMDSGVGGVPEELPLPPEQPHRSAAAPPITIRTIAAARRRGVANSITAMLPEAAQNSSAAYRTDVPHFVTCVLT